MSSTLKKTVHIILLSAFVLLIFFLGLLIWGKWHDEWSGYNASVANEYCNVAVVPLVEEITSLDGGTWAEVDFEDAGLVSADQTIKAFKDVERNPDIKGLLLRIDSPGGTPVASEMIANSLKRLNIPTVALIREIGTSGGYLAATGADTIIASPFSELGSIGVTMSYLENWQKNQSEGLNFVELSSGPFKDYGSPDKPLTPQERSLLERDLKIYHAQFVKEVAENRDLPIEHVAKLADGSSMPGVLALENKLIDELGDQEEARSWFADKLGMPVEEVIFCE
jgi:protease-4